MDLDYISTRRLSRFYDKLKDWLSLNYSTKVELAEATQDMRGATEQFAGAHGLVPTPEAADRNKFLKGDATWAAVPDAQASTSGVGGTDGLMLATDKERLDSFREVSDSEVDNIFGAFIGGRDYQTVIIGNQIWLAENLDYRFGYNGGLLPIGGPDAPATPAAWYYNNDDDYAIDGVYKCGLLYNWYAVDYLETNKATLLPPGWHVPTTGDWDALLASLGTDAGTQAKAADNSVVQSWPLNWNGTDTYGLGILPGGYRSGTSFEYSGTYMSIWTASTFSATSAYRYTLDTGANITLNYNQCTNASYLRLVKDIT